MHVYLLKEQEGNHGVFVMSYVSVKCSQNFNLLTETVVFTCTCRSFNCVYFVLLSTLNSKHLISYRSTPVTMYTIFVPGSPGTRVIVSPREACALCIVPLIADTRLGCTNMSGYHDMFISGRVKKYLIN